MRLVPRTKTARLERARAVLDGLARSIPDPRCELDFTTPFELLVATILSAQTTDRGVNKVTPELFRRYPDAASLAAAPGEMVEAIVRPTGYFRTKAKHLRETARLLVERHGGDVPRTVDELIALPGVARKTANVVLGTAFGITSGITVDTHVLRVAHRLGLSRATEPVAVERDLMGLFPRSEWIATGHRLVLHGRYTCVARAPRCGSCALRRECPSVEGGNNGGGDASATAESGRGRHVDRLSSEAEHE